MDTGVASGLPGMGCMRLSTAADRDEVRAITVLHAAFDAGITFFDTADAYCRDADDVGHNERLIAHALSTWNGNRSRIRVATKGGLIRPQGKWVPDGRAKHLAAACAASQRALGVERIDLYQLHAPDPQIPLATSVRALAALQRDGLINAIGLCNVTVRQIEDARRIVEIASVQVELSLWHDATILSGVAGYCIANGIQLLAYRPLGGPQRRRRVASDPLLGELATRHGVTPFVIALAWLADLSHLILPLPGPTRLETVQPLALTPTVVFDDEDRARLDERLPAGRRLRIGRRRIDRPAPDPRQGEVLLIMGLPGAGKSTVAESYVAQGYARLNRDEAGGTLADLLPALERLIASGESRIVLDNTYVSRASRAAVMQAASQQGLPVRCLWLTTSLEDAQVNAVARIMSRHGRLLTPEEMRKARKHDVSAFAPGAQFRYQRQLEPPDISEGFTQVDAVPFARRSSSGPVSRALIVWCDGVLYRSRSGRPRPASADDVEVFADRADVLRRYQAEGWILLGMSWQPQIAEEKVNAADVEATFARMRELLGLEIDIAYCPHGGGPPICWCRKPLPGLGVVFIHRYALDPSRCIYIGAGPQDPGFARRLGFEYRNAADFFAASESIAER